MCTFNSLDLFRNGIVDRIDACRYFDKVVDYNTRLDTLHHMVRAWLQMTAKEGIETWIAHGTLLGWWWNAKVHEPCPHPNPGVIV
jgi:hypothetical protein